MTQPIRAAGWIFSLAFFPLGLGGVALGTADVVAGFHSRLWQPVPAVILSSALHGSVLAPAQPDVRYRYSFEGRSYVSNRLWPGRILAHMPLMRARSSHEIVEEFKMGETVVAYVNPSDAGDVALVVGPEKAVWWLSVFTLIFLSGFWSPLAIQRFLRLIP